MTERRVEVLVHSARGGIRRIEREASWSDGGLAVTAGDAPGLWTVTLIRGGRGVFKNMNEHSHAVHAAEALLALGDWQRDEQTIFGDEVLHAAAKALAKRLQREGGW